ncbi:PAS domain S-box protein [Halobacteriovorax sp. GB3]|uniref:PAS domain S-box protein n=1 Tax=Halobacteriovorax sp. GB3 TaxID=2719615 RepID=UPI002361E311|nr:PAS domain S-box protein [Halobacteriovorax sp. GB3]MDD0854019.1 PAS domain S-box protein [Halobacteriovorax sp. GB3]
MEKLENQLFKVAYLNSPIAKIIVNSNGRITNINNKVAELFKYERNELINAPVEILLPIDLRYKHLDYVKEFFKNPKSRLMGEGRNLFGIDKFGKQIPIEIGLTPIEHEGESYAMASIFDISKRIKMELRFQMAIEAAPIAMVMIDKNGKIVLTNKQLESLFGYTEQELKKQPIEILVPNASKDKHPDLVQKYMKEPIPRKMGQGMHLFGLNKNGEQIPIEVGLSPVVIDDETYVMSSILDISHRLEQENKFKNVVEAAPNAIVMIDEFGKISLVNKQCEELFQYSSKELLGESIEKLVPNNIRDKHPTYVSRYVKNPETRAMGSGRDLFGQKKDGTLFPVEVGLRPFYHKGKVSVISSIVDISERVKDKNKILERNEELQQFSYRASHDLRAPLNTISSLAQFIESDVADGNFDEIITNSKKIVSVSKALNTYVSDILNLTKSENEIVPNEEINLKTSLVEIEEKLSLISRDSNVEIVKQLNHSEKLVAQKTRVLQVLENLISNAIKYCDPNKEQRFVKVTTFNDDMSFYINIEDNGLGIPETNHEKVFAMFARFHKDYSEGTGLGLYLVKKHIEKLNGSIRFKSSGDGTVFYLKFPNSTKDE